MASEVKANLKNEQGIETQGIERILPQNRGHLRISDNCTMWLSSNLVIATVALGVLAKNVFALGFWDGVVAIIFFNILGALPVAFFSTLGPKLGLRQMIISRFSFGWVGVAIMAIFNAHDRYLLHRDIKPENMLIDAHNNLLLSDFGLALFTAPTPGGRGRTKTFRTGANEVATTHNFSLIVFW